MDASIRRLRFTIRQLARGKHPNAIRYPSGVRDAVVTLARTRLGHGQSVAQIAQAVGISMPTLGAWLARPRPGLRPVAIVPAPEPERHAGIVLVTSH
jgi:hypothetical protein